MKCLFLDTSSFFVTIALLEDDQVLYLFQNSITDDMSSKIMPIIEDAFNKVAFSINDIDKIIVVNGPGSFTGIRIGVTIAKVLAWSLNKDIITVSSLEFLATTYCSTEKIVPMIDARRGYVYAGIYNSNLEHLLADQYIKYDDLVKMVDVGTFVSFDHLPKVVRPQLNIKKIVSKHRFDPGINPHLVNPNYLKKTEAEEHLGGNYDQAGN